jgi:hypothetical protein
MVGLLSLDIHHPNGILFQLYNKHTQLNKDDKIYHSDFVIYIRTKKMTKVYYSYVVIHM